jgi:hypothetical protein
MATVTPVTPAEAAKLENTSAHHGYLMRVLVALDMLLNVTFLNGRMDETISSHAARASLEGKGWGTVVCWLLNLVSPNHGAGAIIGDLERADAIAQTEEKTGIIH